MSDPESQWLNEEYNPLQALSDPAALFAEWGRRSLAARQAHAHLADIAYGPTPGQTLDLFPAARPGSPVLVFIHGGFWRGSDKSLHAFIAPPFLERGTAVVLLNYDLCPRVKITDIFAQMQRAVDWVARHIHAHGGDPQRMVLVGHSAGAHLAAMLLAQAPTSEADVAEAPAPSPRRALCISGLFDLETVRRVPYLQADLALTPGAAQALSPALHAPRPGALAHTVAGSLESAEFRRQNALLRARWGAQAVPVCELAPKRQHFDILEDLADPASRVHGLALDLLGD